jgi:hypothetical protein
MANTRVANQRLQNQRRDVRDDADARGEHVYGAQRTGRRIPAAASRFVRQPGHYAAGANGTQDVPEPHERDRDRGDDEVPELPPTEPEPVPVEEPPDAPDRRGPYVVKLR